MNKLAVVVSLCCCSLLLHAFGGSSRSSSLVAVGGNKAGGGGPSATHLSVTVPPSATGGIAFNVISPGSDNSLTPGAIAAILGNSALLVRQFVAPEQ
jgi:hypothetical protein